MESGKGVAVLPGVADAQSESVLARAGAGSDAVSSLLIAHRKGLLAMDSAISGVPSSAGSQWPA